MLKALIVFVLLGLSAPAAAAPLWPLDWGPLNIRSRAPLFDGRMSFGPGRVAALSRHVLETQVALSHVNIWAQMPGYFFDAELSRLEVRLGLGLGHGWEGLLELAALARSGGVLDGFIEGFHNAFGITQARRDRYAKNVLRVVTLEDHRTTVVLNGRDRGVGWANPTLGLKKQLTPPSRWPILASEWRLQLPLGSTHRQFASRKWSALAALTLQQSLGTRFGVVAATGIILSPFIRTHLNMPLTEVQKFFAFALMWRPATRWLVIAQYLNHDGIVEYARFAPLNMTTHEFALGAKWAPWGHDTWVFEAGLIENTVHDANTPDFGVSCGVRWRSL